MKPFPNKEYSIILADPPWAYARGAGARGASEKHYSTMDIGTIRQLSVPAADDAVLFLWATFPCLPEALLVMDDWGFHYKTAAFVWVKENASGTLFTGLGHYTRANAEVCLLGVKGKCLARQDKSVKQVIISPRQRHSQKPAEVRDRIVKLYGDVPRIELFARPPISEGWDAWGNEVPPESTTKGVTN